jgi:hypothetical protein
MLAGNVIVYLVGAAWAYATHDEIPDYPTVKRRADAKRREYESKFRRQTADEINRLEHKAAAEKEKLRRRATAQEVSPTTSPTGACSSSSVTRTKRLRRY